MRRLVALVPICLTACGGAVPPAPGDGPLDDHPLDWQFEEVGRVQGPDGSPLVVTSLNPRQVVVAPDGRLAVIDGDVKRIILTDPEGRYDSALGRAGGGPGEFGFPFSVGFDSAGGVEVYDLGHQAVVAFPAMGAPERRSYVDPRRRLRDGGRVALRRAGSADSLLLLRDSLRVVLAAIDNIEPVTVPRRVCPVILGHTMSPLLSPGLVWDTDGNLVVVAAGPDYDIRVLRDTSLVVTLRRPLQSAAGSPALAETYLGPEWSMQLVGGPACRFPMQELAALVGVADRVSLLTEVRLLGNEVWVRRRRPERGDSATDVWDLQRGYLGTLPGNTPLPVAPARDGVMPAIVSDADDLRYVALFRVTRRP